MKKNYTISIPVAWFWTVFVPIAILTTAIGGLIGAFVIDRLVMPGIVGIANKDVLEVPGLVTVQGDEARQRLYDIGLRLQVIDHEYSNKFPRGTIISQQPEAGEKVKKGRHICVIISDGAEAAHIPGVGNMNEREARNALRESGFSSISSRKVYDETCDKDLVIGTEPPSGVKTSREIPVLIKISNGPRPTHADVPNIIGEMLSDAKVLLEDNGLTVGDIEYRSSAGSRSGAVISQSAPPGTTIPLESPVNLVVAGNR
jgi:serine/threonine-protein kinase